MALDGGSSEEHREVAIFEVLSHPTRLDLLDILRDNETVHRGWVAGHLAGSDENNGPALRSDGGTEQVELHLHHHHLPKMAANGIIDYDADTGTIEIKPETATALEVLDTLRQEV